MRNPTTPTSVLRSLRLSDPEQHRLGSVLVGSEKGESPKEGSSVAGADTLAQAVDRRRRPLNAQFHGHTSSSGSSHSGSHSTTVSGGGRGWAHPKPLNQCRTLTEYLCGLAPDSASSQRMMRILEVEEQERRDVAPAGNGLTAAMLPRGGGLPVRKATDSRLEKSLRSHGKSDLVDAIAISASHEATADVQVVSRKPEGKVAPPRACCSSAALGAW